MKTFSLLALIWTLYYLAKRITGNMLTTVACATIRSDRKMLADMGRDVTPEYWKEV